MLGENHSLTHEFPQFVEHIKSLKAGNEHFAKDAKRYDDLDREIRKLELNGSPISDEQLHQLKHDRSVLKDVLYQRLLKASHR